jgi:hypothetical protein
MMMIKDLRDAVADLPNVIVIATDKNSTIKDPWSNNRFEGDHLKDDVILRLLGSNPVSAVMLMVPPWTQVTLERFTHDRAVTKAARRIRHIQRAILAMDKDKEAPTALDDLCTPHAKWALLPDSPGYKWLGREDDFPRECKAVGGEIQARGVSLESIQAVLDQAEAQAAAVEAFKKEHERIDGLPDDFKDAKTNPYKNFPKHVQEAVLKILEDDEKYEWENKLLQNGVLVDPSEL